MVAKKAAKARTKSALVSAIADATDLSRKDVNAVFEALGNAIKHDLGKKGPGVFMIPGLMKIRVIKKPATKARKGTNPFTGEAMTFKAKAARNVVRIRPLSALKDMV
ncbi:MAG: HU family DNA-binding protein [bacterium]